MESKSARRMRMDELKAMTASELVAETNRLPSESSIIIWGATGKPQVFTEECLRLVDVPKQSPLMLTGWLVVSLPFADCSPIRQAFFDAAKTRLGEIESPERVEALLRGLGPKGAEGARWAHSVLGL